MGSTAGGACGQVATTDGFLRGGGVWGWLPGHTASRDQPTRKPPPLRSPLTSLVCSIPGGADSGVCG